MKETLLEIRKTRPKQDLELLQGILYHIVKPQFEGSFIRFVRVSYICVHLLFREASQLVFNVPV